MSGHKKIAIVCNYELRPDRIGGMDRFFSAYDLKLKELGYQVHWYFSKITPYDFYAALDTRTGNQDIVESYFIQESKAQDYDVIVTHFLALCTPFFREVKKLHKNARVIAVDHNPRPIKGFPLKKRLKNKVKGFLYGRYIDLFVGVSQYTCFHIIKDYGSLQNKKTQVVYNGIDTTTYKRRSEDPKTKFIVASHLRPSKGIHDLVVAVGQLPEDLKNSIEIDIYGEGPSEASLKRSVQELNLQDRLRFKGSTSRLPELYKNYSYLLQPTYMECFSLSILESLVCNVPVVTTPVGGNLEVVAHGKNGFIYNAGDVVRLREILEGILKGDLTLTQKDVATPVAQNFNLEKMVQDHLAIL